MKNIELIPIPFDLGASQLGCRMGPDALIVAGLQKNLVELGHIVECSEPIILDKSKRIAHTNKALKNLAEVSTITAKIKRRIAELDLQSFPIFMGGDHSISAGTVSALAAHPKLKNRPLYVLWLDAHTDFHSLDTTQSGHLHGTPVAYFTGQAGFENGFPAISDFVAEKNIAMMGLRSVDLAERERIKNTDILTHDMRVIDEHGVGKLLSSFLKKVKEDNGWLHVSFDVDFLDPTIAPAVGTTVPGGANFREAHLVMELLYESGVVSSLDLVELNPFLDEKGKTARLLVDLTSSLFGKRIMDRKTRSF